MQGRRILFGLDRPPRGIAWDHPRLPGLTLGPAPLRLNSHPVPMAFVAAGIERADRRAAVQEWLELGCGDYAVPRVRFIARYLDFVAADLERLRPELKARAAEFDGLYQVEDWMWSALRPLPRAWIALPDGPATADFAFWDGRQLTAMDLGMTAADALREAGALVLPVPADGALDAVLPASMRGLWRSDGLPSSPFRRRIEDFRG